MGLQTLGFRLEPNLDELPDGATVDAKVNIQMRCPGATVCSMSRYVFLTDILVPVGATQITILGAQLRRHQGRYWFCHNDQTRCFIPNQPSIDAFQSVVETCAGLGAACEGYKHTGSNTVAYVEQNGRYAEFLRQHREGAVIHGDVTHANTHAGVMQHLIDRQVHSHIVSGGVACQPFSRLGDEKQGQDVRSQSLTGTLTLAHHTGATACILECTQEAFTSEWAQMVLAEFCRVTGFTISQKVLELHNTWTSRRTRWWCVLMHPSFAPAHIPDMPIMRFAPGVMYLTPSMLQIDEEEQRRLTLDEQEIGVFQAFPPGIMKNIICMRKTLPTATHSWGSQATRCDCGCRNDGFSSSRLNQKGIHAVLIPIADQTTEAHGKEFNAVRHMHPHEVSLHTGLSPHAVPIDNKAWLRLLLSGVGQLGSPLQAIWVLANVKYQIGQQFPIKEQENPRRLLATQCRALLKDRDFFWGTNDTRFTNILAQEIEALDSPIVYVEPHDLHPDSSAQASVQASRPREESVVDNRQNTSNQAEASVHASDHSLTIIPSSVGKGKGTGMKRKHADESHDRPIQTEREIDECIAAAVTAIDPPPMHPRHASTGGIGGFETHTYMATKRSAPVVSAPEAESIEAEETDTTAAEEMQDMACANTSQISAEENVNAQPEGIRVRTAEPSQPLVQVKCSQHNTVGQIVVATQKLNKLPDNIRPVNGVGAILPPSQIVEAGQVIIATHPVQDSTPVAVPMTRGTALWHQGGRVAMD